MGVLLGMLTRDPRDRRGRWLAPLAAIGLAAAVAGVVTAAWRAQKASRAQMCAGAAHQGSGRFGTAGFTLERLAIQQRAAWFTSDSVATATASSIRLTFGKSIAPNMPRTMPVSAGIELTSRLGRRPEALGLATST